MYLTFLYLVYFLINPEKGIISFFKLSNQQNEYELRLNELKKKNNFLLDKISRLQINTIDLDYLDEQLRLNTGYILENELVISLEK